MNSSAHLLPPPCEPAALFAWRGGQGEGVKDNQCLFSQHFGYWWLLLLPLAFVLSWFWTLRMAAGRLIDLARRLAAGW